MTSKIEWTDKTWNPIRARGRDRDGWHCEKVSRGCKNCYAERQNGRFGTRLDFKPGNRSQISVELSEKTLLAPLKWRKSRMVFVCSMTDIFADFVTDAMLDKIFTVMMLSPGHTFQVLTKRPKRMREYLRGVIKSARWLKWTHPETGNPIFDPGRAAWQKMMGHVWFGTSIEDQATAEERLPHLFNTPSNTTFISIEPISVPIDLSSWLLQSWRLDWVIAGGESGPNAEPARADWFRALRDQCAAFGVPFFFKQWGEWIPQDQASFLGDAVDGARFGCFDDSGRWVYPTSQEFAQTRELMFRVGKKTAGRTLDGVIHDGFPA